MKPLISEFSYGYALTEELVLGHCGPLVGAPVFPSLLAEGTLGYDVQIPSVGAPLFLQFKLSDQLVRLSAAEAADFGVPYYRFHLRARRHSMQHDLLQQWQASGEEVFYVAPLFHTQDELNVAYAARSVFASSALFAPMDIDLPDDDEHYVSFSTTSSFFIRCSENRKRVEKSIKAPLVAEVLVKRLHKRLRRIDQEFFSDVSDRMITLARRSNIQIQMFDNGKFRAKKSESLASQARFAAYLARSVIGAELFIIQ